MLSIDSHAMVGAQTQIGPQRTRLSRPSALPYDISARPTVPPMRLVPPATAGFNPTSSSLATALTLGNTIRDPSYGPYSYIQLSNAGSYKQETSLADALDPALVSRTVQAAMPVPIPQAVVLGPPGGTMPTQQAQAPVELTPAQTVWPAFPPTPGFTNGSTPEGGSPYGNPQTPAEHVGFMDPSRYTQHIQPCAMPLPEHPHLYNAMNAGVTTETPGANNNRFHPASVVGTSTMEMEVGSSPLSVPEAATGTPGITQESGAITAPEMSQERWNAFLHQRDNCTVFDTPFANVDFGIVLPTGDEQGKYRPTIHEHRAFEATLAPDVRFHIANMRHGIQWNRLRRSQRTGEDPLRQYEIPSRKGEGRDIRCPLCHEEMQRNLRTICHHVGGTKHLNIRYLYYNRDYSTPEPEPKPTNSNEKAKPAVWEGSATSTRGEDVMEAYRESLRQA